jgi:hypothetical protein
MVSTISKIVACTTLKSGSSALTLLQNFIDEVANKDNWLFKTEPMEDENGKLVKYTIIVADGTEAGKTEEWFIHE